MGWGGIKNLPPDGDVFGGKQPRPSIVDEAMRGKVPGLSPGREQQFADLKRNLLHQDYLRYFDSCLLCAGVLGEVDSGRYSSEVLRDIIEPALATAVEQMQSIRGDAERSVKAGRRMPYDPMPSLSELYRRSRPLAIRYPTAAGAADFDTSYEQITTAVRGLTPP